MNAEVEKSEKEKSSHKNNYSSDKLLNGQKKIGYLNTDVVIFFCFDMGENL